jgi:diguanylate cyclase (GGDEF)-like protein/PAS domain S-box-containing protein/putative nucleotidyltransferase with HDIG domain
MKIKYKALLIGSLSVVLLIVLTYFIFNFTYFGYINKQQQQEVNRDFEVIDYIINNEEENINRTLKDWAQWDDTYQFINDSNEEYIESNLQGTTLETLNLKMMLFLNTEGDIVYNNVLQLENGIIDDISDFITKKDKNYENTGLLLIKDKVFIVAAIHITDSNAEALSNGSLIFVREINQGLLSYIQSVTNVTLKFNEYNSGLIKSYDVSTIQGNQEVIRADKVIEDIDGNNTIVISILKQLSDFNTINFYFNIFIKYFLILIGAIVILVSLIGNKYILKRIYMLDNFMNTVAATKDTTLSLKMPGRDEFYKLANSINKMLKELNSAYKEMKEKDNRFRFIMEATNDGFMDFYVKTKEVYISREWKSYIGYYEEDGNKLFFNFISKLYPECKERLTNIYKGVINGDIESFAVEYRVVRESGDIVWVQQRGKTAEKDEHGKPVRIVSTLSNITGRKKHEEEILFLSYSDKLTGLNNRVFMENQFDSLDGDEKSRYFIIIGDINGLKIANDSIGHLEGDKLLCIVSNAIKGLCEADDVISRWGGDEFVILIRDKSSGYVSSLVDKIREAVLEISELHFKISIALGYAEKGKDSLGSESVMSLAEKRMYRNKLVENNSARNATISSLLRTLHEKHSETEAHTMRIKSLSMKLAKRLNLSQDKLDEIELLALLHDIGKIGVPEQILLKPTKLTNEEWEIMKSHTEVGFRIAKSTPELSHIAYEILSHHEKYDGTGYPNGLKGEQISILARIINVIDSFDVMTHDRVYSGAMSAESALKELRECSGSQFDPFIVDEFIRLLEEDKELCEDFKIS